MSKQLVESSKECVQRSNFRKPHITLLFRFKTEKRGVSPFFIYFFGPLGGLLSLPPPEGFPGFVEGKPADPLPLEFDLLILLSGFVFRLSEPGSDDFVAPYDQLGLEGFYSGNDHRLE